MFRTFLPCFYVLVNLVAPVPHPHICVIVLFSEPQTTTPFFAPPCSCSPRLFTCNSTACFDGLPFLPVSFGKFWAFWARRSGLAFLVHLVLSVHDLLDLRNQPTDLSQAHLGTNFVHHTSPSHAGKGPFCLALSIPGRSSFLLGFMPRSRTIRTQPIAEQNKRNYFITALYTTRHNDTFFPRCSDFLCFSVGSPTYLQ